MTYLVGFTAAAARQLRQLDGPVRLRLIAAIQGLPEDPRPAGTTKLVGEQTAWRIRLGDYTLTPQEQAATAARWARATSLPNGSGLPEPVAVRLDGSARYPVPG